MGVRIRRKQRIKGRVSMTNRVIAVIGTAGRNKADPLTSLLWEGMTQHLCGGLLPNDKLVSGGAAWADHIAVHAFINGYCNELTLHLPAPFVNGQFEGAYGTSGGAANYYHKLFSKVVGEDTLGQITCAINMGAHVTYEPVANGYGAMARRNAKVATDCSHMLAYTFGAGDVPADGGTLMTWNMAAGKKRKHIPLPVN
jgi:hypothetical protein